MITLTEILAFTVAGALGWFIWSGLKAREIANAAMREACAAQGLLFLDDTVALESVRPARDEEGRLRLRRVFRFEYSEGGQDRHAGRLTLRGEVVHAIDIAPPPPGDAL